jgi:Spy/CpxP family protein refolding chaperone
MKRTTLSILLLIAVFTITVSVSAQSGPPRDGQRPDGQRPMGPPPDGPPEGQRPPDRMALFRVLGLSQDQVRQIRQMNQARRPLMDAARDRLHEANRRLDEAIYADTVNEEEVQIRLKEAQAAQSEMTRLKFMGELEMRKVLTPEQLIKFREVQARFERAREDIKDRIDDRRQNIPQNGQPLRPVNQRPGQRPGGRPGF